jgi:hypothetical protein
MNFLYDTRPRPSRFRSTPGAPDGVRCQCRVVMVGVNQRRHRASTSTPSSGRRAGTLRLPIASARLGPTTIHSLGGVSLIRRFSQKGVEASDPSPCRSLRYRAGRAPRMPRSRARGPPPRHKADAGPRHVRVGWREESAAHLPRSPTATRYVFVFLRAGRFALISVGPGLWLDCSKPSLCSARPRRSLRLRLDASRIASDCAGFATDRASDNAPANSARIERASMSGSGKRRTVSKPLMAAVSAV